MAEQALLDDALVERIGPHQLRASVEQLKAQGFTMLLDIGGVDYLERTPRFEVVYHFLQLLPRAATVQEIATPTRVRIRVAVGGDQPVVPSITDLWQNANWPEREVFDLFGIRFEGHPDLTRIQMPHDWVGHPLRKDYDIRGDAKEATPRPNFASKSNVGATTPPSGRVAAALERRIAQQRANEAKGRS